MVNITAAQVRAARGYLDWTREDLAHEAGLSPRTIQNIEKGCLSPRDTTATGLSKAFDKAGIIFPPEGGMRQEYPEVKSIEGQDGIEIMFENLLYTARKRSEDMVGIFTSLNAMHQCFAINEKDAYSRLDLLSQHVNMKFILTDLNEASESSVHGKTRSIPDYYAGPYCTLVCGNKSIIIQNVGQRDQRNIIINDPRVAIGSQEHFYKLWHMATPLMKLALKLEADKQHISNL